MKLALLLTAAIVAISLFLRSAKLVSAVGVEGELTTSFPVTLPPTCLGDLASLSSRRSGGQPNYCMPDQFM